MVDIWIKKLIESGINVITGLLEKEGKVFYRGDKREGARVIRSKHYAKFLWGAQGEKLMY